MEASNGQHRLAGLARQAGRGPRWAAAAAGALALALSMGGTARSQEPLKLGVLNDLTGAFADLGGTGSVVAAQMAVDDFGGQVLGRKIAVISADSQNKPDVATGIARRWFDAEKVDVILDPVPSAVALSINSLARERNKVVIIASSGLSDLTGKGCAPTSFQWAYDTSVLANGTASTVVKDGGKNWYLITADVAFGYSLANESKAVVLANGGAVKGEAKHPYITSDFSSYILQAQASGADVVALADSGTDTTNAIKQAIEFGIGEGGTRLVALLAFITQIKSLDLERAKGLLLTESFYWDLNDETRAWSKRFGARFGGLMPSMAQAAVYSGVSHYLKAVAAAGTTDGMTVADKMRELPISDFMIKNGRARRDGRVVHDFYLFQVKAPGESKGPWDLYKLVRTIPAAEVTPPEGSTGCPF